MVTDGLQLGEEVRAICGARSRTGAGLSRPEFAPPAGEQAQLPNGSKQRGRFSCELEGWRAEEARVEQSGHGGHDGEVLQAALSRLHAELTLRSTLAPHWLGFFDEARDSNTL